MKYAEVENFKFYGDYNEKCIEIYNNFKNEIIKQNLNDVCLNTRLHTEQ